MFNNEHTWTDCKELLAAEFKRPLRYRARVVDPAVYQEEVLADVLKAMPELGFETIASTQSPLVGGKSSRKKGVPGNVEYLALLKPAKTP